MLLLLRASSSSTSTRALHHYQTLHPTALLATFSPRNSLYIPLQSLNCRASLPRKHCLYSTMANPALSTLHHVTDRKLNKLACHREQFEADKKAILASVAAAPTARDKLQALLEGFQTHDLAINGSELSLPNLRRFAQQSKHDPSVPESLLRNWQAQLEHELDVASRKYEYAALFGNLVVEWIQHPNPAPATTTAKGSPTTGDSSIDASDSFDKVGRKEMHEQRKIWEDYAFTERKVDQHKIKAYLDDIFDTALQAKKIKKSPLQNMRDEMKRGMHFKSDLQTPEEKDDSSASLYTYHFTVEMLKSCIEGVLDTDLLVGQKREGLVELKNQPAVLEELVDVLNMDIDGLDTWEWDPTPVPLHMRRQLNGKYRVYMDEETHQAILLHFIGKHWAVRFKNAFTTFYRSDAWTQTPFQSMSRKARQRREYFEPKSTSSSFTIRDHRRDKHGRVYFMTQLPNALEESYRDYGAQENETPQHGEKMSPMETKQSMLRLVTTELLVNTKIYGSSLVWQSDFKWFGPSLPHDTIFAVLEFFGVPPKWLRFFKKYLEVPVVFAQDGPGAEANVRRCGIPMSHIISDALSEAVLFCLDFAVNKRTQGANIYRFHDDLWFWGQESTCIEAWGALQEFTTVMGLELNAEKSGSALIVMDEAKPRTPPQTLPQGKIKWGFLTLDAEVGRWVIDRKEVDKHIEELQRQLGACRSVMAWVQAWNSYVTRFFPNNFGNPAKCLGQQHNDMIIDTFAHIQRSLFANTGTVSVTDHLRSMLKERFGTDDSVPDGFFYFPVKAGGLDLRNPFISAFLTYKDNVSEPGELIDRAFEDERDVYERLKDSWDSGKHQPKGMKHAPPPEEGTETDNEAGEAFMGFEEYTRYREETSMPLRISYDELLECPNEETIRPSVSLDKEIRNNALDQTPYWRWIYSLYAGDLKQKFGGQGMQIGERDLLPVGLVDVLKSENVRWEG